jgi:hypothetical protein
MNPSRLERFAEAYAPALLEAVRASGCHLCGESAEAFTLGHATAMLDRLQRYGLQAIEHYYLNARGGAFRRTCEALGIECSSKSMEFYLEGGTA